MVDLKTHFYVICGLSDYPLYRTVFPNLSPWGFASGCQDVFHLLRGKLNNSVELLPAIIN